MKLISRLNCDKCNGELELLGRSDRGGAFQCRQCQRICKIVIKEPKYKRIFMVMIASAIPFSCACAFIFSKYFNITLPHSILYGSIAGLLFVGAIGLASLKLSEIRGVEQ